MKKFFTAFLFAASAGTLLAGVSPTILVGNQKAPSHKAGEEFSYLWVPQLTRTAPATRAEGGSTVTISFDYDAEKYACSIGQLVNAENGYMAFAMNDELVFEGVVPGEYYAITNFRNYGAPGKPGSAMVVKKITVYDGEDSWLTSNPDEATEIITFKTVLPDGSAPVLPTATEDTQYYPDMYDYTNANVDEIANFLTVSSDELGALMMSSGNQTCTVAGTPNGEDYLGIAISPVDDTWHFGAAKWMKTFDETYYFTCQSINGTAEKPEPNDPNFIEWAYDFATNPVNEVFDTPASEYGITATPILNGRIDPMGMVLYAEMNPKIFLSEPKVSNTDTWNFNYAVELNRVEYDVPIVTSWGEMPDIRNIMAPLVTYDAASNSLVYLQSGSSRYGSPLWWTEDGDNPVAYPGNTLFATSTELQKYPLGSTAPVAVGVMVAYEGEPWDLNFSTTYVGLYGEGRCADSALTTAIITIGDEEVVCDMDKFEDELSDLCYDGNLKGAFSLEFLNDQNIVFDGIKGYNNLKVDVADGSGSDVIPPTFTMMQFKDAEGVVENSFDKGSEGIIELTGADFEMLEGEDTYWACSEPKTVKVEYAPANSEDFKEIAVEMVPENYYMPEYGYFWRGSLADVEGESENGWFQVRLTMTDEAGNSHCQTIYPAFRINELTGIDRVSQDFNNGSDIYYNLQGNRVNNPKNGVFIKVNGGKSEKVFIGK